MRISDSMITSMVTRANQQANQRFVQISERIASNQAVSSPADHPVDAARIVRLDGLIGKLDSMDRVRNQVEADLDIADRALTGASDVLGNLKQLSIQASSGAPSGSDYRAFTEEAKGDLAQLVTLANAQTDEGRPVFAGIREGQSPYDADGNLVSGGGSRRAEVAPGVFIEATVTPEDGFGAGGEIFGAVQELVAALDNQDQDAVRAASESLDGALEAVLVNQSKIGSRIQRIRDTGRMTEDMRFQLAEQRASVQEIDLAAEATALRAAETALNAVTQVSSRLLNTSIASFLG